MTRVPDVSVDDGLSAERPWGAWFVLDEGPGYKVKRIEVQPGHRLSYQTHAHRSEHWLVVSGVATFVIDGEVTTAGPGEHVDVDLGAARHRLRAAHGPEEVVNGLIADPAAAHDSLLNRLPEVEADQDA